MKNKTIKCNVAGCNKKGKIKTHIGWICSEECRTKVQKNIFRALMGYNLIRSK